MKIFPLKLLSNYDKAQNIINIIENPKHMHTIKTNENKYGIKVEIDFKKYAKYSMWNSILNKYSNKFSEIVKGINKNYGKKSTGI